MNTKRFLLQYDYCSGYKPITHSFTSEKTLETFNEFFDTEEEVNKRYNELKAAKKYSDPEHYTFFQNFKLIDRK